VGSIHLIRFPDEETEERAEDVLLNVNFNRVYLRDNVVGVADEHIDALRAAHIPFEWVSKAPARGRETKTA
jgi:hypothetical protein